MPTPQNISAAKIVLKGIIEDQCIESIAQLLEALPDLLGVEIPSGITNVVVSNIQPSDNQTTSVWFRLSNAGSFMGIYVFANGIWNAIYPTNVEGVQIFWQYSATGAVPAGFEKITVDTANISSAVVTALIAQYVTESSVDTYFAMQYVSF